ncbi:hypothetical protein ZHAS_00018075 [Anopheles sinensis]|uniref:Uncharacterized protein n=1 Tax=Anopheles sinensis TaxID=74873 RepID=A0A084WII7_ANOSI|nr:hypothetical protein ZHAS_00018075 [Anopheles sinensis]
METLRDIESGFGHEPAILCPPQRFPPLPSKGLLRSNQRAVRARLNKFQVTPKALRWWSITGSSSNDYFVFFFRHPNVCDLVTLIYRPRPETPRSASQMKYPGLFAGAIRRIGKKRYHDTTTRLAPVTISMAITFPSWGLQDQHRVYMRVAEGRLNKIAGMARAVKQNTKLWPQEG